jgi:glucosamine 6-phosphate synthetase-like amidotransferase/phosphosugar isomerase protein
MIAKGSMTVAICNVVGSMVAREAHGTIYTHAGPEIGVASTKAFTAQLTALFLFALHLAQKRETISPAESAALVDELSRIPGKIEEFFVFGPRDSLPHRARGSAEAQGNLLHPRRRVSGRRDEAWAECPDR